MATDLAAGDLQIDKEVDVKAIEASARRARAQGIRRLLRYTALKLVAATQPTDSDSTIAMCPSASWTRA